MAQNKNQHYVPQFYFRFFSKDGKNIEIFNLKDGKHYSGPFKNQSSKDYFYHKDKNLEEAFSKLEDSQNRALKKLIDEKDFKKLKQEEYVEILRFLTFQRTRTENSKIEANQSTQIFVNEIMKPLMLQNKELSKSISKEEIEKLDITYPADHLFSISIGLQSPILISDLIPIILENKTNTDFIFSDHPVVFYNLFFSQDEFESHIGFQSLGLQIFCPLSDKLCLLLFDPCIYEVAGAKNNTIEIQDNEDIEKINRLQFHNCNDLIHYSDKNKKEGLTNNAEKFLKDYPKQEQKVKKEKLKVINKPNSEVLMIGEINIHEWIELSFIRIKKVRNQRLIDFHMKELEKLKLNKNTDKDTNSLN
ncbi:DUF4238 domain-containing protein [Candidatus Pacearchaeota archaeon]|nr:DUF4238 domain-containing protein [Candidatus Pacearchaeota archaeon]